jgi:hypothetical protein
MADEKRGGVFGLGGKGALNIDDRLVYLVRKKADGNLYKIFNDGRPDEKIEPEAKEK